MKDFLLQFEIFTIRWIFKKCSKSTNFEYDIDFIFWKKRLKFEQISEPIPYESLVLFLLNLLKIIKKLILYLYETHFLVFENIFEILFWKISDYISLHIDWVSLPHFGNIKNNVELNTFLNLSNCKYCKLFEIITVNFNWFLQHYMNVF